MDAAFWLDRAVETPVFASVIWLRTVEIPVLVVDSELDSEVNALRPEET